MDDPASIDRDGIRETLVDADAVSAVSLEDDEDHNSDRHVSFRARSPETEMASLVSRALVGDLQQHLPTAGESAASNGKAAAAAAPEEKQRTCCVCGSPAIYTCPGCGHRTCSITCVRVHKSDHGCSGTRDVTVRVPLSEFTDAQLQRDFRFLEDCRRVVSNAHRLLPRGHRFNFRTLPPPLRSLREAARRRGVVCQFMSEGLAKREANTSRYDRSTNTIMWRCDFVFHKRSGETVVVGTNWGSERHRLGDVLRYCWATNPPLPCYHINQTYNHSDKYVGARTRPDSAQASSVRDEGEEQGDTERKDEHDGATVSCDATAEVVDSGHDEEHEEAEEHEEERTRSGTSSAERGASEAMALDGDEEGDCDSDDDDAHRSEMDGTPDECAERGDSPALAPVAAASLPEMAPLTPQEAREEAFVRDFLDSEGGWCVLSRAERLGEKTCYFLLDPATTLNENMRALFFVNEFPVFDVIHADDLAGYPLVTDADREAIRASFRAKERTPEELLRRQHPGLRLKSDLDPEEAERLAKVPCRMNLLHRCVAGDNCPYWHCTLDEWPQCRSFQKSGRCPMGYRCSFRHGDRLPGDHLPGDGLNAGKRPRDSYRGRGRGDGRGGRGRGRGYGRGRGRGRGSRGRGFRGD